MGLKPAPDELVLGQVRDWNEELQTARELPSDTVTNKIFRERSLYKVCYIVHYCIVSNYPIACIDLVHWYGETIDYHDPYIQQCLEASLQLFQFFTYLYMYLCF